MKLTWDEPGSRLFQTGVTKTVLFPIDASGSYEKGVAWNGVTDISIKTEGAEASAIYANNRKILESYTPEIVSGMISAYSAPEEFSNCDGTAQIVAGGYFHQQSRRSFGLVYRTELGNDILGENYGYQLHIVYNCKAKRGDMTRSTIADSISPLKRTWNFTCIPVIFSEGDPLNVITIDSISADPENLENLENILYGTLNTDPRLPDPDEIYSILDQ